MQKRKTQKILKFKLNFGLQSAHKKIVNLRNLVNGFRDRLESNEEVGELESINREIIQNEAQRDQKRGE